MTAESCTLPYPERFQAAGEFVSNPPEGAKVPSDETRLLFFSLSKQATQGPCQEPKPWGWNAVENAKWQSWSQLGDMSKEEAMRLYVRTLEELQPDWWTIGAITQDAPVERKEVLPVAPSTPQQPVGAETEQRLSEAAAEGSWSTPYLDDAKKPVARYEHGMVVVGPRMFVIGGNAAGGRYLNDVWIFDLSVLEWSRVESKTASNPSPPPSSEPNEPPPPPPPPLPPIAGHKVVAWKNTILVIGGHVKTRDATADLIIRVLDPQSLQWSILKPSGKGPCSRGGHTATLVGNKLFVIGGEDIARRPLGDLFMLDLDKVEWSEMKPTGQVPAPRSGHSATAVGDFIVLYGGGSLAHCFNDTCVLDTKSTTWHKVIMHGRLPSTRAGHAASLLGRHWYIVGGGNNAAGCTDMAYLDVSPLFEEEWSDVNRESGEVQDINLSWTIVGTIPERSYIASEGMSLVTVEGASILVSFGGYNGKYSNALSLFRPQGDSFMVRRSVQATGTAGNTGLKTGTPADHVSTMQNGGGDVQNKLAAAWKEAENASREAAAAKEAAAHELALMRRQLMAAQTSLSEKEKAHETVTSQLQEEQSKSFKLEAEIAVLRHQLQKMNELEKELEMYRRQAQESQKKGGGIWGWVGGSEA